MSVPSAGSSSGPCSRSFLLVALSVLLGACAGKEAPAGLPDLPQRPRAAQAAGLLAAYPFSEGTGTTTADASGGGVTGTVSGAAWAAGHTGGALSFNGSSSFVDLGSPAALQVTGSLTVSAWVNESANVGDDGIIAARSTGVSGWELKSSPDTGQRRFAIAVYDAGGGYVARFSNTVRATGVWYHVAGVYDAVARTLHLYVNGALDDGALWGTVPAAIAVPAVNVNLGRRAAGFHVKGILDDVRIYGRALAQAEVQADQATPVGGAADTSAPTAPASLVATPASATQVSLSWAPSSDDVGVSAYRVYRGGALAGTAAATAFVDSGLAASTTYSYEVSAIDAAGNESARSAAALATTLAPPADAVPPSVAVTSPAAGAVLTGTAVALAASASDNVGVAGVQFLLDGAPLGAEDAAAPYALTWNTTSATSGVHLLSARARDAAGNVSQSPTVSVTVDNQPPVGAVVINGGAAATKSTASTLTLSASDALGAVAQMRFSNTGTSYSTAQAYAATKAWTLASGAGVKTVYVQFKDAAGNWSAAVTDTIVLDTTAPVLSAVAASQLGATSAVITWTSDEPATSQVEYGATTSYGQTSALDASLASAHAVALSGLSPGTRYYYRARSKDAAGNERLGSRYNLTTTTAAADTTPPSAPGGLSASAASPTRIDLAWSPSTDNVGVAGYRVTRDGLLAATVTSGTAWSDAGLVPQCTHTYAVVAFDKAGNVSAASAAAAATTLPDVTAPATPAGLTAAAASPTRVDLAWAASTDDVGVTGYEVLRDGLPVGTAATPAWSDTGLQPGTSYLFEVAAFDAAGNTSPRSSPVVATTPGPTSVSPANVTLFAGATQAFTCTVSGSADTSCTWSVAEGEAGGTVTATGASTALYTAPAAPGTFHVVATANAFPAQPATATVSVRDGAVGAAPMPLISRFSGVRAFASNDLDGTMADFGANRARDDVYDGWGRYWRTIDLPYPAWVAYDLSAVPEAQRGQVVVAWYNESDGYNNGAGSFTPLAYNEPADYVLEGNAAPGGAAGAPAGGWVTLISVSGNTYHSRSHLLDLTGYNWLRFRGTAGAATNQPGNRDCELKLEVFDAHQGNTDSWAFLGDSIANGGMSHLERGDLNFAQRVHATAAGNFPLYENAGIPFDGAQDYGAVRLQALLANSVARYIGLSYGMNDAGAGLPSGYGFYDAYKALVDAVLAAGRIPVIPTISWTAQEPWQTAIGDPVTGPELCLNRQLARLKADYRAQGKVIVDGPDLWTFFKAHPSLIGAGDIHPTTAGYVAMRNLWAEAMLANVYRP